MKVNGKDYLSVAFNNAENCIDVIDQQILPFYFKVIKLYNADEAVKAISDMTVRGAPAIGILAAWGSRMAVKDFYGKPELLAMKFNNLLECRPTAVNLAKGTNAVKSCLQPGYSYEQALDAATVAAKNFSDNEITACKIIGENGLTLIENIFNKSKNTVNILTHCNAGWLACGDWGTALSPVFAAHRKGIPVHVWVDETRPRNQGANLTAWELFNEGIDFTIIPDNSGGLLMMQSEVDIVITGADRIAANGDTANKTGTYLKALAASDNNIPFYIAAPSSTFDFNLTKGVGNIPIEIRNSNEICLMKGIRDNKYEEFRIIPNEFHALNHAFDITPARLINGYITEKGIFNADQLINLL